MARQTEQGILLDFFKHYPYFPLFISSFGNLEKEFAAMGIVLMALEKGEWGTNFAELIALRTNQGAEAVEKWEAEYEAFRENRVLNRKFEKRNNWTLGLYGLFAQKPTALDEPRESLLSAFTREAGGTITAGYDELHDEGFVVLGEGGSITPTDKFFERLLNKYRKAYYIPA